MVRPSHVAAPDLPGEAGSAGATRELSRSPGCAETPGLMELGRGSGGRGPSCQARRPYATWPRGEGEYGLWESEGLDTLAGGTPICMYRQRPSSSTWLHIRRRWLFQEPWCTSPPRTGRPRRQHASSPSPGMDRFPSLQYVIELVL
jgi:hypothetical protein